MIPASAAADVRAAFQDLESRISKMDGGRNWDVHGRRVINAGSAVDNADYVTKADVTGFITAAETRLLARVAGEQATNFVDLIVKGRLAVGQGSFSGLAQMTATSTTIAQLALLYSSAMDTQFTVGSTGNLTIKPTGTNPVITVDMSTSGTGGFRLQSGVTTGSGITSAFSVSANALTTGTGVYVTSSTLTTGILMDLSSSSGAVGASATLLNVTHSGGNVSNAITTYGAKISNTRTNGTSGTNIALQLTASGATTANYGLLVTAGFSGFGLTVPLVNLHSQALTEQLRLGYDASNYTSFITSSVGSLSLSVTGTNPSIVLSPSGTGVVLMNSKVGINGATVSAQLHVTQTTEQLRLGYDTSNYNSFTVASAGALTIAAVGTNPSITLTPGGTGNVILSAQPRFNGTNTTGAGSAVLSTNCPASTATAPYTWIKALSSDGSTVYFPVWK